MEYAVAAGEASENDPIIYFTLIDFLIQIIFCIVFAFIAFQTLEHERKDAAAEKLRRLQALPGWVSDPIYLPLIRDLTPFITIENEGKVRELLKLLKEHGALEKFLEFLQKSKFAVIEQCLNHPDACERFGALTQAEVGKFVKGVGLPPCLPAMDQLFQVDAFDDRLVILSISNIGRDVLNDRNIRLAVSDVIAKQDVRRRLTGLSPPECMHYISYVKRGDSEDMRHSVEQFARLNILRELH